MYKRYSVLEREIKEGKSEGAIGTTGKIISHKTASASTILTSAQQCKFTKKYLTGSYTLS